MKFSFDTNHHLLFFSAFAGFLLLSMLIAVGPATQMDKSIKPSPEARKMTGSEERGFRVYVRENCAVCHTQQVRPLKMDNEFGRASRASDFASLKPINTWIQTPNVLGTARVGPDLANIGRRRNNMMWNYMHLYNPRSVVESSVMPSYFWLFKAVEHPIESKFQITMPARFIKEGKGIVPTSDANDLVAYLMYLQQPSSNGDENETETEGHMTTNRDTYTPDTFDYVVIGISAGIVVLAFIFLILFLVRPGEKHKSHIKHKVLTHE